MIRITRILFVIAIISVVAMTSHAGATPEEMIQQYFEAFKLGDMQHLASIMHDGELEKFKKTMLPVIESGVTSTNEGVQSQRDVFLLKQITGRDAIETIREESPRDFFVRFMKAVLKMNPTMTTTLSGATIQTLGFITENDMAHVVYRMSLDVMGAKMTQMNLMSVKQQGDEWRLMLTGEVEGMSKLLEMRIK